MLAAGLAAGAYPGAVALWGPPSAPQSAYRGLRGLSRDRRPVTEDLIYDLASLTKVLSTTSLALLDHAHGRLDLNRPLADGPLGAFFRGRPWTELTPEHLLAHQSGLPAWRPFHRLPSGFPPERRRAVLAALAATGPEQPPARRTLYSDLNFIILGFLLEELAGQSLPERFESEVQKPLKLKALTFKPTTGPLAPTEDGFRWGGPIGNRDGGFRGPVPLGRPHDDNAAFLGGAAGHAGLFGAASDIWTLARQWSLAAAGRGGLFQKEALEEFSRPRPTEEDGGRPLGFNLLGRTEAARSSALPPSALGHTGYTGPALWWDREGDFMWLFLCNRVQPRAANPAWRPALCQAGPVLP